MISYMYIILFKYTYMYTYERHHHRHPRNYRAQPSCMPRCCIQHGCAWTQHVLASVCACMFTGPLPTRRAVCVCVCEHARVSVCLCLCDTILCGVYVC